MTRREKARIVGTASLAAIAQEMQFTVKAMTPYQLRFTLEEHGQWDYYPVSNKVNKVGTTEYLQLTGNIIDWVLDKKHYQKIVYDK